MPFHRHLGLITLLLLIPGVVDARLRPGGGRQTRPVKPDSVIESWRYSCDVEQRLKGGTATLTRLYTDDGKLAGGDFMRWNPADYDPQHPGRPLDIELSYIWDPSLQPAVEPRKIELKMRVGIDVDLPEVASIEIKRPFPVEPYGVIGSTALSTEIFPYGSYDAKNGHGELPLGDLLAYADGFDTLDWTLLRRSDRLGGSKDLARGKIDIAALREAVATLPALRAALAIKTAQPKASCEHIRWSEQVRY